MKAEQKPIFGERKSPLDLSFLNRWEISYIDELFVHYYTKNKKALCCNNNKFEIQK